MVNNQATIAQWRIKNKQNCCFYWLSTVNPYPLSLNTNILYLLTMFCVTDIFNLCNLHCSTKINMEVVIKAMDILNHFGWHHFISDCISHFFFYQLPQFMITYIYTWPFLSYSYNVSKYNIHSQYHIHKNERKVNDFMQKKLMFFFFFCNLVRFGTHRQKGA